jgi:ribonucleoside-diphosphate reductase alpha chain
LVDWERLEKTVRLAVKFLDNVIDICEYPLAEIDEMSKKTRKVGLGVMGFADLLFRLGIAYNSNNGVALGERLAKFIKKMAREESVELGKRRGSFPAFVGSKLEREGFSAMRNSTITTVAPTGTISILASCSSGIEPIFALRFTRRNILDIGKVEFHEFNDQFKREIAKVVKGRKKVKQILEEVARTGSCQQIEEIPDELKRIFVTSHDIDWKWHIKMQAAWQQYIDSAVSKTINLVESATVDDVKNAYLMAYKTGCMGITIYRDKSRRQQVLNLGRMPALEPNREVDGEKRKRQHDHSYVVLNGEEGVCPDCRTPMVFQGGCATCPNCSYSYCSVG